MQSQATAGNRSTRDVSGVREVDSPRPGPIGTDRRTFKPGLISAMLGSCRPRLYMDTAFILPQFKHVSTAIRTHPSSHHYRLGVVFAGHALHLKHIVGAAQETTPVKRHSAPLHIWPTTVPTMRPSERSTHPVPYGNPPCRADRFHRSATSKRFAAEFRSRRFDRLPRVAPRLFPCHHACPARLRSICRVESPLDPRRYRRDCSRKCARVGMVPSDRPCGPSLSRTAARSPRLNNSVRGVYLYG